MTTTITSVYGCRDYEIKKIFMCMPTIILKSDVTKEWRVQQ